MLSEVIGSWISRLSSLGVENPNDCMILGILGPWSDGDPSAAGQGSSSPLEQVF
jgi:hypothetical protein